MAPDSDADGLTYEQRMLRDNIRRYMKERVAPHIQKGEAEKRFPLEVLSGLADFGYLGGYLPERDGGMGSTIRPGPS